MAITWTNTSSDDGKSLTVVVKGYSFSATGYSAANNIDVIIWDNTASKQVFIKNYTLNSTGFNTTITGLTPGKTYTVTVQIWDSNAQPSWTPDSRTVTMKNPSSGSGSGSGTGTGSGSGTTTPTTYTITIYFDNNGGSGGPDPLTKSNNSASTISCIIPSKTPTRTGYEFLGWSDSSTSSSVNYSPNKQYNFVGTTQGRTKTVYAVWKKKGLTCYVRTASGWKQAIPYIRTANGWKEASAYIRTTYGWKPS